MRNSVQLMRYSSNVCRMRYYGSVAPPRPPSRELSAVKIRNRPRGGAETYDMSELHQLAGGVVVGGGAWDADVDDPALPCLLTLHIGVEDGRLVCNDVELHRRPGAPPITGTVLRGVVIDTYMRLALAQRPFLMAGDLDYAAGPVTSAERQKAVAAQRRREVPVTLVRLVEEYRKVLADPALRDRATAEAADRLHLSRGHASRLLARARDEGLLLASEMGRGGRPRARLKTNATKGKTERKEPRP